MNHHPIYPSSTLRSFALWCSQHRCVGGWDDGTYGDVYSLDGPCAVLIVWVRALDTPKQYGIWFPVVEVLLDRGRAAIIARDGWTP